MNEIRLHHSSDKLVNAGIRAYIYEHIADFHGQIREEYPIPRMIFDSQELAFAFVEKLSSGLGISKSCFVVVTATCDKTGGRDDLEKRKKIHAAG